MSCWALSHSLLENWHADSAQDSKILSDLSDHLHRHASQTSQYYLGLITRWFSVFVVCSFRHYLFYLPQRLFVWTKATNIYCHELQNMRHVTEHFAKYIELLSQSEVGSLQI